MKQVGSEDTTKITEDSVKITDKKRVAGGDYFHLAEQYDENLYSQFFDTSLKGGFTISYSSDSVDQFLLYKKKNLDSYKLFYLDNYKKFLNTN